MSLPWNSLLAEWPIAVRDRLRDAHLGNNDLDRLFNWREGDVVLLVGSYAVGEATALSDIDFLIVTEHANATVPEAAAKYYSTTGESYDIELNSVCFNIEFVSLFHVTTLLNLVRPATLCDRHFLAFNFQPLELRLIHRILTGIPVTGHNNVHMWRSSLDLRHIRDSVTVIYFLVASQYLHRALFLTGLAREWLLRSGAEALTFSFVNAYGSFSYDVKHLYARAATILENQPEAFSEIHDILSVQHGGGGCSPAQLSMTIERFHARIVNDPELRSVANALARVPSTYTHFSVGADQR